MKHLDPQEEARRSPERYLSGYPEAIFEFDDELVVMGYPDFERLPEYSATDPTGVVIGKCWKACLDGNGGAQLHPDPTMRWAFCWFDGVYNRQTGTQHDVYRHQRPLKVIGDERTPPNPAGMAGWANA